MARGANWTQEGLDKLWTMTEAGASVEAIMKEFEDRTGHSLYSADNRIKNEKLAAAKTPEERARIEAIKIPPFPRMREVHPPDGDLSKLSTEDRDVYEKRWSMVGQFFDHLLLSIPDGQTREFRRIAGEVNQSSSQKEKDEDLTWTWKRFHGANFDTMPLADNNIPIKFFSEFLRSPRSKARYAAKIKIRYGPQEINDYKPDHIMQKRAKDQRKHHDAKTQLPLPIESIDRLHSIETKLNELLDENRNIKAELVMNRTGFDRLFNLVDSFMRHGRTTA